MSHFITNFLKFICIEKGYIISVLNTQSVLNRLVCIHVEMKLLYLLTLNPWLS
jgi:hypothetical protein